MVGIFVFMRRTLTAHFDSWIQLLEIGDQLSVVGMSGL
jgi:hypothetical protein